MSDAAVNPDDANENLEWELSDLVDTIAAEIDEAQDTLSLKSYSRGLSLSIKKVSLNIEVKVRYVKDGRFLFRTIGTNETSDTVLKLDFDQVLQSQLTDIRKSFEGENGTSTSVFSASSTEPEDPFSDISDNQRRALEILGIRSLDDLKRYPKSPQIMAEISRKTGISIPQIQALLNQDMNRAGSGTSPNFGVAE